MNVRTSSSDEDDGKEDALDAVMWSRKKSKKKKQSVKLIKLLADPHLNNLKPPSKDLRPLLVHSQDERNSSTSIS